MKITIKLDSPVSYRILHNPAVPVDPPRPDVVETAYTTKDNNYSAVPMTEAIQWLTFDLFRHGTGGILGLDDCKRRWRMLYSQNLWGTNTAGFESYPPRRDYISKLDMTAELPILQKGITFAGHVGRGKVVNGFVEFETLSPSNAPTLDWLLARPWLYFEAKNVNALGQSRFPQAGGNPVLIPWFCQDGKVARLPLDRVERLNA
jgi:hypothetical protein